MSGYRPHHQPLLAPDEGSEAARLSADLEAAGWTVIRTVDGGDVRVQLLQGGFGPDRRWTGPTLVDALRPAHRWALRPEVET